jgi:hypothetical protein
MTMGIRNTKRPGDDGEKRPPLSEFEAISARRRKARNALVGKNEDGSSRSSHVARSAPRGTPRGRA